MQGWGAFILFFVNKEKNQKKNFLRKAYALRIFGYSADARFRATKRRYTPWV